MIFVISHACIQFRRRVSKKGGSPEELVNFWDTGYVPSPDQLEYMHIKTRRGFEYRLNTYNGVLFCMVLRRQTTLVTVMIRKRKDKKRDNLQSTSYDS
jgi:hypothetical protein